MRRRRLSQLGYSAPRQSLQQMKPLPLDCLGKRGGTATDTGTATTSGSARMSAAMEPAPAPAEPTGYHAGQHDS